MTPITRGLLLASLASLPFAASQSHNAQGDNARVKIVAIRSGSPIEYESVSANDQGFWIGKETSTSCPSNGEVNVAQAQKNPWQLFKTNHRQSWFGKALVQDQCPAGEETIIEVSSEGYASLDVKAPGGQTLYVDKHGYLGFTQAQSGAVPSGAQRQGFSHTQNLSFGRFQFKDHSFVACPTGKENGFSYRVLVALDSLSDGDVPMGKVNDCFEFEAITESYEQDGPAAWQYT